MIHHRHHRKRRSQGGDDSPENILEVSPEMHDWIHKNVAAATALGWLVPEWADPATIKVQLQHALTWRPRARKERSKEKPRNRVNVTVNVPKDEREDGAGILDDLIQHARELLAEPMGWDDNVPAYFVLVAVLHDWLTGARLGSELER
jgi:hypothetical protein